MEVKPRNRPRRERGLDVWEGMEGASVEYGLEERLRERETLVKGALRGFIGLGLRQSVVVVETVRMNGERMVKECMNRRINEILTMK
jgi:hypothetical protein